MQKVSLALNIVLCILVAVLFYLVLKHPNTSTSDTATGPTKQGATMPSDVKIAYIDLDSLEAKYEYFNVKKSEFIARGASIKNTLAGKQKILEAEYNDAQNKAATMTQMQLEQAQLHLQQKQQEIAQLEEQLGGGMESDQMKFQEEYQNKVENYLAKYNKDKKYTFVLSYRRIAAMVLYKDDRYDITNEVVDGLNKEYKTSIGK